MRTLRQTL